MKSDRAGQMVAFVRTVQLGGFSRAARELGCAPSALSKMVGRLEERLGVRLLSRTTRKLLLTPEGQEFYASSERILTLLDTAENEITSLCDRPRGLLRMHTFIAFGQNQLVPALPRFFERYPDVQLELSVSDRVVNLFDEKVDLCVNIGPLPDSTLYARKICDLEFVVCAAPTYLQQHGTPSCINDLARHNCISVFGTPGFRRWPFGNGAETHHVEVSGKVATDTGDVALQLALMGFGIVRLLDLRVLEYIRCGKLVPLRLHSDLIDVWPLNVVYLPGKHRSPKITAMVNFLCERFSDAPWKLSDRVRRDC